MYMYLTELPSENINFLEENFGIIISMNESGDLGIDR